MKDNDLELWNIVKKSCIPLSEVKNKHKKIVYNSEYYDNIILEKENPLKINMYGKKEVNKDQISYVLDLHGLTVDEAYNKIVEILNESFILRRRQILVITGKGLHSNNDNNIKNSFLKWIKYAENISDKILKYEVAKKKDGGEGAFYIWIK